MQNGKEGEKKFDKEKWAEGKQRRQDKKVGLAERDDTQVQYVRTEESRALMKIQSSMDFALYRLRRKGGFDPRYPMEKMVDFMARFRGILVDYDKLTTELCQLMGVEHRTPPVLKEDDEEKEAVPGEAQAAALPDAGAPAPETAIAADPAEPAPVRKTAKKAAEAGG